MEDNTNPVIQLLASRISDSSASPERKLVLVVEGGGMRGVLSAGALLALDFMGGRKAFDDIFAVSSGSVNAAFFLSGQGKEGIQVYFDDISNAKFFNPFRPSKMLDVDYVYDHVVPIQRALDERAIIEHKTNLHIGVTDVLSGKQVMLHVDQRCSSIASLLKASSALPVLYNRTVDIGSGKYVDGGMSGGLPINRAIERGATDILVLSTKLKGSRSNAPNCFQRSVFKLLMGYRYPALQSAFGGLHTINNYNRQLADGHISIQPVNLCVIAPSSDELFVSKLTQNRTKLISAAQKMSRRTIDLTKLEAPGLNEFFSSL